MTAPGATHSLSAPPLADLPERTPALGDASSDAVAVGPAARPLRARNLHEIADPRPDLVRAAVVDSQHAVHKARENRRERVARGQETEVPCGT